MSEDDDTESESTASEIFDGIVTAIFALATISVVVGLNIKLWMWVFS